MWWQGQHWARAGAAMRPPARFQAPPRSAKCPAMIGVGIVGAFLGGLLSFVSPCVLPLVPPYLCYVAGLSAEEFAQSGADKGRRHIVLSALSFVLGFSTVFVALGATASVFGQGIRRLTGLEIRSEERRVGKEW